MTDRPLFARCGVALFGEQYQSALARAIGVNERTVRRWVANEYPIPAGVWNDIANLLGDRRGTLGELVAECQKKLG